MLEIDVAASIARVAEARGDAHEFRRRAADVAAAVGTAGLEELLAYYYHAPAKPGHLAGTFE